MTNQQTTANYSIGQKALKDDRTIVAIENGKVCVEDLSVVGTAAARFQATRKWYKVNSPILARVFGEAAPELDERALNAAWGV